jgi:hypothetical protein
MFQLTDEEAELPWSQIVTSKPGRGQTRKHLTAKTAAIPSGCCGNGSARVCSPSVFPPEVSILTNRRARPQAVAAALLLATVVACNGKQTWRFEGHVSRSTFWEYHDQSAEVLCPTLLDLLDEHARTVGGKLGLTLDQSRPLRYYRFEVESGHISACGEGVSGCAVEDAVLTTEPFHAHEQVHAYVSRAWGKQAVGLLVEGEAVALSCEPLYRSVTGQSPRDALDAGDWRKLLYLHGNSNSGYSAAGFWVTYLAQRFGWAKVQELHRRALPGLSAADFGIEFARVFPVGMDEAWAAALSGASPPCDSGWRCRSLPWVEGEAAQPDCDGHLHRTIAVGAESGLVLTHRQPLLLQDCDAPPSPVYELVPARNTTTSWAQLPPGRYAIFDEHALSRLVSFVSYLPSPFVDTECAQAGKVTLASGQATMVDLLPGAAEGCLRLDGGGQWYAVFLANVDVPDNGAVSLCDSGEGRGSCVVVPARGSTTLALGATATVHFQNVRSVPPASRSWGQLVFFPAAPLDAGVSAVDAAETSGDGGS